MPLIVDSEGRAVSSHSLLKAFKRCPKQVQYRYVEGIVPKVVSKPLKRGSWFHSLVEAHYRGEDWRVVHQQLTWEFKKLFVEEQDALGNLPDECARLMRSYLWHYEDDEVKVLDVEFILETPFPDGSMYRCKIDALVETEFGLGIMDHKTGRSQPGQDFRITDAQSALYLWCARRNKIPVEYFIWNYIRAKPPTRPKMTQKTGRLSRAKIDTDYPTFLRGLRDLGLDPMDYKHELRRLKAVRYRPGEPQTSPFFERVYMEKSPEMVKRVAQAAFLTSKRVHRYYEETPAEFVERVSDRSCTFMCGYTDLCTTELYGGNSDLLRRKRFVHEEPDQRYADPSAEMDKDPYIS